MLFFLYCTSVSSALTGLLYWGKYIVYYKGASMKCNGSNDSLSEWLAIVSRNQSPEKATCLLLMVANGIVTCNSNGNEW